MTSADRSHYQAMGLAPAAGPDEIRAAYLRLARSLHPDRFMDASPAERGLAERRMREVNAAWTVLGNPGSRQDYDRMLRSEAGPANGSTRSSTGGSSAPPPRVDQEDELFVRKVHRDFNGRPIDVDDGEEVELTRPMAFFLRRGPIIVMIMLALGLFVGTALADGRRDRERIEQTTTTIVPDTVCPTPGGC